MRIKVFSLSLSRWYQSQGRKLYSFWFTRVIHFGNPFSDRVSFRSPFPSPKVFWSAISWSENPHQSQHFSIFPVIFSGDFSGDIFRHQPHHQECKEEICNFSQITGAKHPPTRLPRATLLRRPESHAPAREGAWPTFQCQASSNRLVKHRLALLSLRQASPNPASPFFWHFSLCRSSFNLLRPPTAALFLGRDLCVPWEGLFFIPNHFYPLFGSRHTRFFFHSCDPTSL